jgi:hypothetical protein
MRRVCASTSTSIALSEAVSGSVRPCTAYEQ